MELNILNLLLILLAAWAGGALATRLGYPAVLGELLIGILLGPPVLGWLQGGESFIALNGLAQVGVLLLMLYVGMEVDPEELGKASWAGFLAAMGGFLVPFVLGYVTVLGFGGTHMSGLFVGIAVGVTSLAVNSRILFDLQILDTRIAHVLLAGALITDTLALVIFAGLMGAAGAEGFSLLVVLGVIGRMAAFLVGATLVGLYVLPRLFRALQRLGVNGRGFYFTLMLLIALAFAEAAELAGLHAILGTFAAGLFLRKGMLEPRLNRELDELVRDVSVGFLAPIFFVLSGFEVSFDVFRNDLAFFLLIMLVATGGKIIGTALFYLPTGRGWREGLVLGGAMNGRGAVEIIIAGIGLKMGLITQEIFSVLVFMAIITTATVPVILKWGTEWLQRHKALVRSEKGNVTLIIGANATARALARLLGETGPVSLLDANAAYVEVAHAEGFTAATGNALDTESLFQAQANLAGRAVAMTANSEVNVLAARQLREVFRTPALHILALGTGHTSQRQTFRHLEATRLFGRPVPLADWDHHFAQGEVVFEREPVGDRTAPQVVTTQAETALVMAYETEQDGHRRVLPFHGAATLKPTDVLVIAHIRPAADM